MVTITVPLFAIYHGQIGGVESAIYNLVRGLYEQGVKLRLYYATVDRISPNFWAWAMARSDRIEMVSSFSLPGPKAKRFFEETLFENSHFSREIVIYPNYHLPRRILPRLGSRCVIIHDTQYRSFPEFFSRGKRAWLERCYNQALKRADHVFLISEHEKSMIGQHFGTGFLAKCSVIYNAIDIERFDHASAGEVSAQATRDKYILSVCHQFEHKNVATLIRAFSVIAERRTDLKLYLVGKASAHVQTIVDTELSEAVRQRIRFFGFVTDADLGEFYRKASLFVLPSLYEGFGMPAVEALSYGIPTVLSDATALPEIACGFATLVPHKSDPIAWAEAILNALNKHRDTFQIEAGVSLMKKRYSPASVARRLLDVIGKDANF